MGTVTLHRRDAVVDAVVDAGIGADPDDAVVTTYRTHLEPDVCFGILVDPWDTALAMGVARRLGVDGVARSANLPFDDGRDGVVVYFPGHTLTED
jgi:hypothetical protein